MGSKYHVKLSRENSYLRNTYKDPAKFSHSAIRTRGNIMSIGPDLVGKLLDRAGTLNPLDLEGDERIVSGNTISNKLYIDQDFVEDEEKDDDSNEADLSAGMDSDGENPSIDQEKLKFILSTVRLIVI